MRAKAFIYKQHQHVLVECIPYKLGFAEGFLHKDVDNPSLWNYTEFNTGLAIGWEKPTIQEAIDMAKERIERSITTPEQHTLLLNGLAVINTTYQDYVPQIGDVVRITEPRVRLGRHDWDEIIGTEFTVTDAVGDYVGFRGSIRYADGDFIPVTCPIEGITTNRFIVDGERPLPDYMIELGRKLVDATGLDWRNDHCASNIHPQIRCKDFVIYGIENHYNIYSVMLDSSGERRGCRYSDLLDFINQHSDKPVVKKDPIKVSNELVLSGSFLDFLHEVKDESRIARIILSVRDLQYNGIGSLITNVITTSELNYLTYRADNGNISYLPKGKEHKITSDGKWARDGRQDGKPGKVMRKIFTKSALKLFKEVDFEIFNNKFKAKFEDGLKFAIETDIADVYLNENRSDMGSLGGSCMRDVESDYFDIYVEAGCKIVTLRDKDNKLQGRALLWDVVVNGEEAKFLDRFYVSKDSYYDKFVDYARDKKFFYKEYYKTYDSKTSWIDPEGNRAVCHVTIKTNTDHSRYPYIDTFTYGDDGTLNNFDGKYTYNSTGGEREGDGLRDDITGDIISEDESVTLYDGRITHRDNAVYVTAGRSRYIDNYFPANECFRCGDEYYHEDDVNRC